MTEPETMLGLAEPLHGKVVQKFVKASQAKDLIFSETSLAHLRVKGGASVSNRPSFTCYMALLIA